jgi:hypothetical protein
MARRKKYQTASHGMKKFQFIRGGRKINYHFSPAEHFNTKKAAQAFIKEDKKGRKGVVHRTATNPKKAKKKFTVYKTYYP